MKYTGTLTFHLVDRDGSGAETDANELAEFLETWLHDARLDCGDRIVCAEIELRPTDEVQS